MRSASLVLQKQRGHDTAILAGEHIVRAAGGAGVHDFAADASRQEFREQLGIGKFLPCAGAQHHDFRFQLDDGVEILERELGESLRAPVGYEQICAYQATTVQHLFADTDFPGGIGTHQVGAGNSVVSQFHSVTIAHLSVPALPMSQSSWLTVIVPGIGAQLAQAAQAQSVRWPQLARLAGRGSVQQEWDRRDPNAALRPWQRGLLAALGLPAAQFPSAAVSATGNSDALAGGFWLHAEPVHFVAGLDRLSFLPLNGDARVSDAERVALEPVLAEHLAASGFALHSGAGEWLVRSDRVLAVQTACPEAAAANELERVMPHGPDGGEVRRLMTELQMLLHDHPVNEARARRGLPAINAVWLWGSGVVVSAAQASASPAAEALTVSSAAEGALDALPSAVETLAAPLSASEVLAAESAPAQTLPVAFGEASYLRGIYQLHGRSVRSLPQECGELLTNLAQVERAVAVVKVADIDSLEERWVAPLTRALATGALHRLDLVLDELHCDVSRSALRRFWRRALPLSQWPLGEQAGAEKLS